MIGGQTSVIKIKFDTLLHNVSEAYVFKMSFSLELLNLINFVLVLNYVNFPENKLRMILSWCLFPFRCYLQFSMDQLTIIIIFRCIV